MFHVSFQGSMFFSPTGPPCALAHQGALALDGAFEAPKGMVQGAREVNLHPNHL